MRACCLLRQQRQQKEAEHAVLQCILLDRGLSRTGGGYYGRASELYGLPHVCRINLLLGAREREREQEREGESLSPLTTLRGAVHARAD